MSRSQMRIQASVVRVGRMIVDGKGDDSDTLNGRKEAVRLTFTLNEVNSMSGVIKTRGRGLEMEKKACDFLGPWRKRAGDFVSLRVV